MNKLIAALIAATFSFGAFAQAPSTVPSPTTPAATSATEMAAPAKKAKKAKKARKTKHAASRPAA